MSLRDAVEYAVAHSPALKSAQEEVHRQEGLVTSARAPLLPQVDVSADASRTRFAHGYPLGVGPSLLRFDDAIYTGSADLKLLVWDFDRTELELAAARERLEAVRSDVERRRQLVVFQTAELYLKTLAYTDLIDAAQARIKSLQSLLDRTNQLIQGGRAAPVDALKIETRLAQVESDLATLDSGRRSSQSELAEVMGFQGELPQLTYTPAGSEPPAPAGTEGDLVKQALATRPEVSSDQHLVRAGERAERAASRSTWPRIDFRASVVQYGSDNPIGFPQLIGRLLPQLPIAVPSPGNAATDWLLGVHVSVPVFDGGQRKGRVQAAGAQLGQSKLAQEQTALRIEREVRVATADLESAEARVKSLRDSVAESERVLRDERLKYEAGRSVVNFVLDAESALLANQSLLSQAERTVATASLSLDLALGRIGVGSVAGIQ